MKLSDKISYNVELLCKLIPNQKSSIMFLSGLENSITLKAIPEAANSYVALKYLSGTFSKIGITTAHRRLKDYEEFMHYTGELWMVTLNHQAEG